MLRNNTDPATEARQEVQQAVIKAENTKTFRECVDSYYKSHQAAWKDRHRDEWLTSVNKHTTRLMPMDVASITTESVYKCLEPIWTTRTVTATRIRQRIEAVLGWATVKKLRKGDNPARWKGHLDNLFPKPEKLTKVMHMPSLDNKQAGEFMARLRQVDSLGAKMLQFQILTAVRPGEAAGTRWGEIDLANSKWVIPAERMKAGVAHEVPLTPQAVQLLEALPRVNDFVFPGRSLKKPLTTKTGMQILKELHPGITQHGFRATFRTWASELTSYPSEVIEHALSHRQGDATQRAYDRKTMFPKRTKLMNAWADYCDQIPVDADNVTAIRKSS